MNDQEKTQIGIALPWSLYIVAYLFGGIFMFRDAIKDIRTGRFDIDFLMLVAAIGAASLDKWAEGALLLFLFSLGLSAFFREHPVVSFSKPELNPWPAKTPTAG